MYKYHNKYLNSTVDTIFPNTGNRFYIFSATKFVCTTLQLPNCFDMTGLNIEYVH